MFSPDGTQIAGPGLDPDLPNPTPWYDDILRLIDVRTGRELTTFPDVGGEMTFSPDGKILAYVRYRNKIHLLNIETGEILDISVSDPQYDPEDRRHPEASALIFSPDGEKLVSGTSGGKVQMWDAETGVELTSFFSRRTSR